MDEQRRASLKELESRLGYHFQDIGRLDKALTHKSYIYQFNNAQLNSSEKVANEVLEFLGDAVLNLAVTHLLLQAFPEAEEGLLSHKRSHLVKQSSLSFLSRQLRLEHSLLLGKGELQSGGRKKSSILANTYEAVLGAIYLDSGFERTREIIQRHLRPFLQAESDSPRFSDYKSLLQEVAQQNQGAAPQYQVLEEYGPDHDKMFRISVALHGEVKGTGWGKSKKEAEQEAAQKALAVLEEQNHNSK